MQDEQNKPPPRSDDEAIGRPGPWGERRYETDRSQPGESVIRKPGEVPPDTVSTTVTRKDYEGSEK